MSEHRHKFTGLWSNAYGKMRPGEKRQRPYLCSGCLKAFRMESEESVIVRKAAAEAEGAPDTIPAEWSS